MYNGHCFPLKPSNQGDQHEVPQALNRALGRWTFPLSIWQTICMPRWLALLIQSGTLLHAPDQPYRLVITSKIVQLSVSHFRQGSAEKSNVYCIVYSWKIMVTPIMQDVFFFRGVISHVPLAKRRSSAKFLGFWPSVEIAKL